MLCELDGKDIWHYFDLTIRSDADLAGERSQKQNLIPGINFDGTPHGIQLAWKFVINRYMNIQFVRQIGITCDDLKAILDELSLEE